MEFVISIDINNHFTPLFWDKLKEIMKGILNCTLIFIIR